MTTATTDAPQQTLEDGETPRCQSYVTSPKRGRKQCALALHDEKTKHVTVVRKTYEPVTDEDVATFSLVEKASERAALAPKNKPGTQRQERTDIMKAYDKHNLELYAAWIADGKPAEYAKSRPGKVHVVKAKVDTVKFLVRSSQAFLNSKEGGEHNIGIEFGDDGVRDAKGRSVVSWRVIDRRERKAKNGS